MHTCVSCLAVVMLLLARPTSQIRIGAIFHEKYRAPADTPVTQVPGAQGWQSFDARLSRPQGGVAEQSAALAFEFAVAKLNRQPLILNKTFTSSIVYFDDGPLKAFNVAKLACGQLSLGVAALVSVDESSYVKSVSVAKQMPYIYLRPGLDQATGPINKTSPPSYSFGVSPTSRTVCRAVRDVIERRKWPSFALLYCDSSAIEKYQALLDSIQHNAQITMVYVRESADSIEQSLKIIKERRITNVIVDCYPSGMLFEILKKALELDLFKLSHQYMLFDLDSCALLRRHNYIFGHCNITCLNLVTGQRSGVNQLGQIKSDWNAFLSARVALEKFRVLSGMAFDKDDQFTVGVALMYDALQVYASALARIYNSNTFTFNHRSLPCSGDKSWHFGPKLAQAIAMTDMEGLTGPIRFNDRGTRRNVRLEVMKVTYSGLKKVGDWVDLESSNSSQRLRMSLEVERAPANATWALQNKSFIITTIVESPYVFKSETADGPVYSGYCIDLLKALSDDLGFAYEIVEVPDGEYGSLRQDGSWDGMIGELRNGHADVAVAPLTITSDRERATSFTKPYMSLGVSILYRKPTAGGPALFAFLSPLSLRIWLLVLASYLAVSFTMYFIARLSPYESHTHPADQSESFNLLNSLWYGAGALMQQGSELSPKSMSSRLLSIVWWFFSLIFISSYTANLAAFLTVTRMEVDISSAKDLAAQTAIKYGTQKGGSTASFLRNSKIKTYATMWHYINQSEDAFVRTNHDGVERVTQGGYAFLMESTTLEYIIEQNCNLTQVGGLLDARGYGIATMDPVLRDSLSVSILKLQEDGVLDQLKHKWWKNNSSQCPTENKSTTQSLTIANLGGAFLFLVVGALAAIFTALIEATVFVHKRVDNQEPKISKRVSFVCSCKKDSKVTNFDLGEDEDSVIKTEETLPNVWPRRIFKRKKKNDSLKIVARNPLLAKPSSFKVKNACEKGKLSATERGGNIRNLRMTETVLSDGGGAVEPNFHHRDGDDSTASTCFTQRPQNLPELEMFKVDNEATCKSLLNLPYDSCSSWAEDYLSNQVNGGVAQPNLTTQLSASGPLYFPLSQSSTSNPRYRIPHVVDGSTPILSDRFVHYKQTNM